MYKIKNHFVYTKIMKTNKKTIVAHASDEVLNWLEYLKKKYYLPSISSTIAIAIKKAYEAEIENDKINSMH